MAQNTSPVFPLTVNTSGVQVGSAANVKSDGSSTAIGTDIFKVFTAGANGSMVYSIRIYPTASAAATAISATVVRIFVSSVASGATTNTNTFLLFEQAIPVVTADQTVTAIAYYEVVLNKFINANATILATSHVINAANTNITVVCFGGDL